MSLCNHMVCRHHRVLFLALSSCGRTFLRLHNLARHKLDDFFEVQSHFFPHISKDVAVCLCPLVPDYITFKERISCTYCTIWQHRLLSFQERFQIRFLAKYLALLKKFNLEVRFCHFLTARRYFYSQNIIIIEFFNLILYPSHRNLTTHITILYNYSTTPWSQKNQRKRNVYRLR